MPLTQGRPPVVLVDVDDGMDGADVARALRDAPVPEGWTRRDGFELPARPWDLSDRRWVCLGSIGGEEAARAALQVLVRGVGLVVSLGGTSALRLRVLDDLHHNGEVVTAGPAATAGVALGEEDRSLLRALADGATVDQAARAANISTRTAHRRLAAVRAAYGASNTTEAVARWLADGGGG